MPTESATQRPERTHGLDAGEHAHISSKVGRLEDRLVVFLEVQVHHQRLQLLTDGPRLVLHIPAAHRHVLTQSSAKTWPRHENRWKLSCSYPRNNPKSKFLP